MSKHFYPFLLILFSVTLFPSCGGDDTVDSDNVGVEKVANKNKNTIGGKYAVNNLEFPHLKGGTSKCIVYTGTYSDEKKYGMNFAVEWDCTLKTNRWSCYRFDTSNKMTGRRKDGGGVVRWYPTDTNYPGEQYGDKRDPSRKYPFDYVNLSDNERLPDLYSNTGCDHGHICPSADRLYSQEANIETFYMTNMMPQYSRFNQGGAWLAMENKARNLANTLNNSDTLYIVKGGTVDSEENIIERINGQMIVPKYYYAAFLMWKPMKGSTNRNDPANYKAMAYWFEHIRNPQANLNDCMISIDELELRTGIDFFCNLPDKVETQVEKICIPQVW